ncbi:hypothetical protein D9M70_502680 [compost metagenome]
MAPKVNLIVQFNHGFQSLTMKNLICACTFALKSKDSEESRLNSLLYWINTLANFLHCCRAFRRTVHLVGAISAKTLLTAFACWLTLFLRLGL